MAAQNLHAKPSQTMQGRLQQAAALHDALSSSFAPSVENGTPVSTSSISLAAGVSVRNLSDSAVPPPAKCGIEIIEVHPWNHGGALFVDPPISAAVCMYEHVWLQYILYV